MKTSIALIIGAVIIAAAILFIGRWEIAPARGGLVRLDHWTGKIEECPIGFRDFVGTPPARASQCEVLK
jgi:hypothetical protein